jgi:hypothetical protein
MIAGAIEDTKIAHGEDLDNYKASVVLQHFVQILVQDFAADNPNFDATKFRKACGIFNDNYR